MNVLDKLLERARQNPRHIVLAEGTDERVVAGAAQATKEGIARVTLLGEPSIVRALIEKQNAAGLLIDIINPAKSENISRFAKAYYERRKHKGLSLEEAHNAVSNPLYYAAMMVQENLADGTLAGATHTTGDTVRAALLAIGLAPYYKRVSSFFIMMLNEALPGAQDTLIFADCALVIKPDAEELSQIALASADSAASLLGIKPTVAMLSFSTQGSASHALVDKVAEAARMAKAARPDLIVEGDMQLDAALVPAVNALKAPGSFVGGRANVLIFPDLQSGNIGYKIAQRIGKAKAIGPVIQGLAKPANDLSRGCDATEIYHMIAITCVQAQTLVKAR